MSATLFPGGSKGHLPFALPADDDPVAEGPDIPRPVTRADCLDGPRPCPWAGCRHHLGYEVTDIGSIRVTKATASCSLDIADLGGLGREDVAPLLGLTQERVRQIEEEGLAKLRRRHRLRLLTPDALPAVIPESSRAKGAHRRWAERRAAQEVDDGDTD